MVKKIIFFQFLFFGFIACSSICASFFSNSLSDNFLTISSQNSGFILYYFFSTIIVSMNYYIGKWSVLFFILFASFFFIKLCKRNHFLDILFFVFLAMAMFIPVNYFFPSILGEGITGRMEAYLNWFGSACVFVGSSLISVWLLMRKPLLWPEKALNKGLELGNRYVLKIRFVYYHFKKLFLKDKHTLSEEASDVQKDLPIDLPKTTQHELISGKDERFIIKEEVPVLANVDDPSLIKKETIKKLNILSDTEKYFIGNEEFEEQLPDEKKNSLSSVSIEPLEHVLRQENEKELETIKLESKMLEEMYEDLPPLLSLIDQKAKNVRPRYSFESTELIKCISIPKESKDVANIDQTYFERTTKCLEEKLAEFKINGKIVNVLKGPVVDTFELELGAGVKVSKVSSIAEDLSLALCGVPIRIVYPMRGKNTVGVEVPRNPRELIYLDEILSSPAFEKTNYKLPLALGRNAFGEVFVSDLAKMPHMLVAGSTGSGKSVFINALLVSLLIKKPPQKMRLILIDPKQLELALYAGLEHLILPVITDSKEASISLLWACQEMERRYSILKELGVRNVETFNEKVASASTEVLSKIKNFYSGQEEEGFELPYIVIIIDEFADLIMGKMGKDIELSICRLAAKARASGIHLIIATQRPSVDVITGLIKSNFPTRISFRVTSSIDSRTILNSLGAEKLLGQGDMLYRCGVEMVRLHSSYIGENEIEQLLLKIAENGPCYNKGATDFMSSMLDEEQFLEGKQMQEGGDFLYSSRGDGQSVTFERNQRSGMLQDEFYDEAVRIVMEQKMASASMLQRRLKIGYNRAANLIDSMEANGIVGPAQGAKPREVYGSSKMQDVILQNSSFEDEIQQI